jgi:hypothetical protein
VTADTQTGRSSAIQRVMLAIPDALAYPKEAPKEPSPPEPADSADSLENP